MSFPVFHRMRHSIVVLCLGMLSLAGCEPSGQAPVADTTVAAVGVAEFIGGQACATCHADEYERWTGSHHDLAMQVADETTVLADFEAARFTYNGITSEFFRRGNSFFVRTDGADGDLAEFEVTHAFGVDPLQQYLVALPGGRYQVLTTAWDTRPADQGGQRWFHLYPDEAIDNDDPLHWTGVFQSWNSTCAGCHSTNLEKNYSVSEHSFATSWSSIDVDCEACHGAGSLHAADPAAAPPQLGGEPGARWMFAPGASIAMRSGPGERQQEIETCAQCHARRGQLIDEYKAGSPLLDAFRPALLQPGLYHPDGQILDEVYVYGSFLQSRMHQAGVSCSDCHDPHSAKLRYDGNAVCAQCHLPATYEVTEHHHHESGQAGSACVDCHMPAKTYMVVDPRRDHSFRVPRPDLSAELDTPNACNGCHENQDSGWAADIVREWFPDGRSGTPHYGQALAAGSNWARDRGPRLLALVADNNAPPIVRATAISMLAEQIDEAAFAAVSQALNSESPLMQLAAVEAYSDVPSSVRASALLPFLDHPLRALRLAAARQLVSARAELRQVQAGRLDEVLVEYRQSQAFNSDRSEGFLNIAGLQIELGDTAAAEASLQTAIERAPWFAGAYVNLADLYRQTGREALALEVLTQAVEQSAEDPASHFALGLTRVRAGQSTEALDAFQRAVELAPDEPYYRYIYGVALHSVVGADRALESLRDAHERFPGYRDITFALATMSRDAGFTGEALRYARELLELSPGNSAALALIDELATLRQE